MNVWKLLNFYFSWTHQHKFLSIPLGLSAEEARNARKRAEVEALEAETAAKLQEKKEYLELKRLREQKMEEWVGVYCFDLTIVVFNEKNRLFRLRKIQFFFNNFTEKNLLCSFIIKKLLNCKKTLNLKKG